MPDSIWPSTSCSYISSLLLIGLANDSNTLCWRPPVTRIFWQKFPLLLHYVKASSLDIQLSFLSMGFTGKKSGRLIYNGENSRNALCSITPVSVHSSMPITFRAWLFRLRGMVKLNARKKREGLHPLSHLQLTTITRTLEGRSSPEVGGIVVPRSRGGLISIGS